MTNIGLHRDAVVPKLTQQRMADLLAERGLPYDRVSITRVEAGKQMPPIDIVEAMAAILGIDIDSLLNLTPEEAVEMAKLRRMDPQERARVLRAVRAALNEP